MKAKNLNKFIEKVFFQYQMHKIRLNSTYFAENMNDKVKQMQDYVYVIDNLLNFFNKQEKEFIIDVYIKKIPYYEIPISESNYYYRKRKYNIRLYKYLMEYERKWLQLQL